MFEGVAFHIRGMELQETGILKDTNPGLRVPDSSGNTSLARYLPRCSLGLAVWSGGPLRLILLASEAQAFLVAEPSRRTLALGLKQELGEVLVVSLCIGMFRSS